MMTAGVQDYLAGSQRGRTAALNGERLPQVVASEEYVRGLRDGHAAALRSLTRTRVLDAALARAARNEGQAR